MKDWAARIQSSLKKISDNNFADKSGIMANSAIAIHVGVLIPTFNRASYLRLAVNSALNQSYSNLEIIVIDNGSADGTAQFMASISDPRVRYVVNEKNIGMIGSINKGIALLSDEVEWCTILSDDDLLDRDCITNLLHTAIDTKAKSIVHSHRIFIDKHGNKIQEAPFSPREETAFDYMKMRSQAKRETYLTGVLFNRKSFGEIGGYPSFATGLATDDAFIFALALKDRLCFAQNAIAYIRIHEEAESRLFSDGMIKMQTIQQFGEYCRRAAQQSDAFDKLQYGEFEKFLNKHIGILNSLCWIQTAHYALSQKIMNHEQLSELFLLARSNPDKFTFRVKLAVACQRLAGIFPEKYACYRACWENLLRFSLSLRKLIAP